MLLILAKRKHHHHHNSSQLRMLNIGFVSCICLKCGLMLSVFEMRSYEVHPKQLLFMLFACKVKFLLSSILNISIAQMSEFDFAAWSGTLHNVAQCWKTKTAEMFYCACIDIPYLHLQKYSLCKNRRYMHKEAWVPFVRK